MKMQATFCLEPAGDSPYRRSLSDSIALGCIPVLFNRATDHTSRLLWDASWHAASRVLVSRERFLSGAIDIVELLRNVSAADVAQYANGLHTSHSCGTCMQSTGAHGAYAAHASGCAKWRRSCEATQRTLEPLYAPPQPGGPRRAPCGIGWTLRTACANWRHSAGGKLVCGASRPFEPLRAVPRRVILGAEVAQEGPVARVVAPEIVLTIDLRRAGARHHAKGLAARVLPQLERREAKRRESMRREAERAATARTAARLRAASAYQRREVVGHRARVERRHPRPPRPRHRPCVRIVCPQMLHLWNGGHAG